MSKINDLSFEEVDALLAYDPGTGVLTWRVDRGRLAKAGSAAGAVNSHGYLNLKVHGKNYKAHRLAWLLHTGSWPSQHIDHIDGDRANNRIDNLRECSSAENHQNLGKSPKNTSGVTGVSVHKQTGRWQAKITLDGKQIYLGLFETIEEAAAARAEAKQRFHQFQPTDR